MMNDLQNGRSMLEMLGVLAIVGILTVGGFNLVTKVNNNNQINSVIDEISGLASRVRRVARDYTTGDDTFLKYVCKAKAYPDSLECDLADPSDEDKCNCTSFTGSADVEYELAKADYPLSFTIKAKDLNNEMCMALLTANFGTENSTGFSGFDGISATDIGSAASSCSGDSNTLTLKFR